MNAHAAALQAQLDAALAAISASADASRRAIAGDVEALAGLGHAAEPRPSLPPLSPAAYALIPDSPLVDRPAASAFDDDVPLWQS